MIEGLTAYINVLFIATTLLSIFLFYKATKKSTLSVIVLLGWIIVHGILAYSSFYLTTDTVPPRVALVLVPVILFILVLFFTKHGKSYIDSLDDKWLTWLHIVRIPVEICLFLLFTNKLIPEAMTFEGRNFDIFSGISAPFIAYFGYTKKQIPTSILLLWNFICLALVINVVSYGILSVPSVFQQLSFDQPNVGILYFPFIWLPACIVPLVIFSHIVCIRHLIKKR